ncbi:MAG: TonB family protein [Alphaproteobacteria bacterium]|nr:MAG: TonB family protein [Alphaproteobacteria bacterium]
MIAASVAYPLGRGGKWLPYFALSLFANLALVSFVQINHKLPVPDIPALKVNLMTLARPAAKPAVVPAEREVVSSPPSPALLSAPVKPVITVPKAEVKIEKRVEPAKMTVAPKSLPAPKPVPKKAEPVAEKIVKPVPLPKLRPKLEAFVPAKLPPEPKKIAEPARPVEIAKVGPVEQKPAPMPAAASTEKGDKGADDATVVHEARYRHQVPPVYPARALDLGQQGMVTLHARVQPDGRPDALKIVKSSGHRLLDMAALSAVKKWRFEPTSINGALVTSWVRVPVKFVIH